MIMMTWKAVFQFIRTQVKLNKIFIRLLFYKLNTNHATQDKSFRVSVIRQTIIPIRILPQPLQ